ncbi:Acetyl-coenzyme A synthetase N-terminus [Azotobacter beijerinckii]|uniref:Acetyl-coenzyme A synthetase N-terminus n=1 Tax=Azotobacter beijerinckii TaxID=170623 RepID=A0A1H6XVN6_9GAMM|nr:Acetyl-coenzyme A synthetase N-terminus [Azotobacter beijerinckii]SEJ28962.1 Acetyl-coenzyme A synthetase N-terminus [Azotobacter beijerinckii]
MNYQHSHERSIADPAGFWAEQAQAVSWFRPPTATRAMRKKVAGHRLSTGEMEDLAARHPAVAECAVIGVPDAIKGQVPLGLIVLKDGSRIAEQQLQRELTAIYTRAQVEAGSSVTVRLG